MAAAVRRGLQAEGIVADLASTGEDALWMAGSSEFDAMVLDVMLPGIDGFETCKRLREDGVWAPIIMLTARDSVEDRVKGLDQGADDYLVKPFSLAELLARLRALARRGPVERPPVIEVGDLRLDPATQQAWRGDDEIELSPKEFALMETFMRRPGRGAEPLPAARARLGLRLREPLQRGRGVRALPAGEGGPAVRREVARDRARRRVPVAQGRGVVGLSRLPIRVRMTVAFALAMTLLLAAMGVFVYERQESNLDEIVDTSLRSRSDDVAALVRSSDTSRSVVGGRQLVESDEGFIQILTLNGRLLDGTTEDRTPVLRPEEARQSAREPLLLERHVAGVDGPARILARPVRAQGRIRVVVTGSSLSDRDDTLTALSRSFLIGGPDRGAARLGHRLPAGHHRLPPGRGHAPARKAHLARPPRGAPAAAHRA